MSTYKLRISFSCFIICNLIIYNILFVSISLAASVFKRGNIGEPDSLDPHLTTSGYSGNILSDMFVGLTSLDAEANVIPGVAESWSISANGKHYIFNIREDVFWSDGNPVTSEDFVYSFKRMLKPETASPGAPMLYMIDNAREINSGSIPIDRLSVRSRGVKTLEIDLVSPTPYFLELIVHRCYPVPKWVVEEFGSSWTRPENIVVNGPFVLNEWLPNNYIRLLKNSKFYDSHNVFLDSVFYYPTENLITAFNRYRANDLDMIVSFPPSKLDWIKENLKKDLRIFQSLGLEYITFNTTVPPFDDVRVRKALSMSIDREMITSKIMRGGETPAYSLIPEGARNSYKPSFAVYKDEIFVNRIEMARELLASAGFNSDNPLSFEFRYNSHEVVRRVVASIVARWSQTLGVKAELLNSDLNVLNADLRNGDYEVARYQWFAEYRDPSTFLYLLQSDSIGDNHSKYINSKFDSLMLESYQTKDIDLRMQIMQKAERIVMDEAPITPLNFYVSKRLIKPHIKGIKDNVRGINLGRYISIE